MPFFGKTFDYAKPGGKVRQYVGVRFEEGGDPEYHMFVTPDQDWVIIKSSDSGGTLKYYAGRGDVLVNWAGRGSLVFKEYWEMAV